MRTVALRSSIPRIGIGRVIQLLPSQDAPPCDQLLDLDLCSLQLKQYLNTPTAVVETELVEVFDFSTNKASSLVLRPKGHVSVVGEAALPP